MPHDRLNTLLQCFPLQVGCMAPISHFPWVSEGPGAPAGTGWLHLLLRGGVHITPLSTSTGPTAAPEPPLQWLQPCLLWSPEPQPHRLSLLHAQGTTVLSAPVDFGAAQANPLLTALPGWVAVLARDMPRPMASLWQVLISEFEAAPCGHASALCHLGGLLLVHTLRRQLDAARGRTGLLATLSEPKLRCVLDALHQAPGSPWTLQRLADHAGMSRTALATAFAAHMGQPLGEYLTEWRLQRARQWLRQNTRQRSLSAAATDTSAAPPQPRPPRSVKAVAQAVGYASPAAFTRAYTLRFGHAPSDIPPDHTLDTRNPLHTD